jgi:hypothetical protein
LSDAPARTPAPIIVTALFERPDQAWFDEQRREYFPPERNQLDAHLTMFHHLAPSLEQELRHRLTEETRGERAPDAQVGGLVPLGRGVAYRIDSPGLRQVRARLAEAFGPMLTPQDAGGWRPHVTIQNKATPAAAKVLMASLQRDFRPRTVTLTGYAAWFYRGGPWELISRHLYA